MLSIYSRGKKNHLSLSPGQVKFQAGQAYISTQCPADKRKIHCKFIWQYISDKLIDNKTSKNLTYLARGTSENFKIFLPLYRFSWRLFCA